MTRFKSLVFICCLVLSAESLSRVEHIIEKNSTLSEIADFYYPNERLYGEDGKIQEILVNNPGIANPNLIEEGSTLIIANSEISTEGTKERSIKKSSKNDSKKPQQEDEKTTKREEQESLEYWTISSLGGFRYLNHEQTGAFGSADNSDLKSFNYKIINETSFSHFYMMFYYQRYNQEFSSAGSSGSDSFDEVALNVFYRVFGLGFEVAESPIFENKNSSVSILKFTKTFLKAALRYKIGFLNENMFFKSRIEYAHLIKASLGDTGRTISNEEGHLFRLILKFEKNVQNWTHPLPLWLLWENELSHGTASAWATNINNVTGEIKTTQSAFISQLGLMLRF